MRLIKAGGAEIILKAMDIHIDNNYVINNGRFVLNYIYESKQRCNIVFTFFRYMVNVSIETRDNMIKQSNQNYAYRIDKYVDNDVIHLFFRPTIYDFFKDDFFHSKNNF